MTDGIRTEPISSRSLRRARGDAERRIAVIVAHAGGVDGLVIRPGEPVVVGRGTAAHLCIDDGVLSRGHARFELAGDRVVVEDLGSTNGTWHHGQRIDRMELQVGEVVLLGRLMAHVQVLGPGESPPTSRRSPGGGARGEAPGRGEPLLVAGAKMTALLAEAKRIANARVSVLLRGETGTGKELLARFLHEHSPRRDRQMATINCAAIPEQLLESLLFGHERGAFTGAVQQQKGLFEGASGGTLFLDEIGELPLPGQAALLRVLETRRIHRVGSLQEIDIDVRLISATHRDLDAMCAARQFRDDLLFRLNSVTLTIPPLRERLDEIEPLALRFLREANARNQRAVQGIEPAALAVLHGHAWPGNVRELRNVIERAVVVTTARRIRPEDLPDRMREGAGAAEGGAEDLLRRRQRFEAEVIREALAAANGNKTAAARVLGMPLRTLYHKLRALGLKDEDA